MDDDNSMDVNFTDLDLNQEPENSQLPRVSGFRSLMEEMDTAQDRIEERIRQLEAVVARARQRQRWRASRNNIESTYLSYETNVGPSETTEVRANSSSVPLLDRASDRGKGCKRDSSHLIAKALEIDSKSITKEKEGGSFYDCNICLELAKEPVLTPCGHLFCWACFYQVSKVDLNNKECPVCKGEVSDNTVIPIYGNGGTESVCETTLLGLKIPPRPKGQRIESLRQQNVANGSSHLHVLEALRRIRITFGGMGDETRQQGNDNNNSNNSGILHFGSSSQEGQNEQSRISRRSRIQHASRVLSESAASLSSLSSALNSAERLLEDLETVINSRFSRSDAQPLFADSGGSSNGRNQSLTQSGVINNLSNSSEIAGLPIAPSSESSEIPQSLTHVLSLRASINNNVSEIPSSSASSPARRRSLTLRSRNRDPREARRRRLN